jgi:hypothetical protein
MRVVISSILIQDQGVLGRGYFPKAIAIRAFINLVKSAIGNLLYIGALSGNGNFAFPDNHRNNKRQREWVL